MMRVLHQSRGKAHAAAFSLGEMTTASRVAKQSEERAGFEPIHDISQRPQFPGLSGEWGMPSSRMQIQAKMIVGEAGDQYELEAERLAPQIVHQINTPGFGKPSQTSEPEIQSDPPSRRLKALQPTLQLKGESAESAVSPAIESAIKRSARGGGQPLEPGLQNRFGHAMGVDLQGVTVHRDSIADSLNQSIQAEAFTTGQDIFFRGGAYNPGSREGQELIAHELTHVAQQGGGQYATIQREKIHQPTSITPLKDVEEESTKGSVSWIEVQPGVFAYGAQSGTYPTHNMTAHYHKQYKKDHQGQDTAMGWTILTGAHGHIGGQEVEVDEYGDTVWVGGYADPGHTQQDRDYVAGSDTYLGKPVHPGDNFDVIDIIETRPQGRGTVEHIKTLISDARNANRLVILNWCYSISAFQTHGMSEASPAAAEHSLATYKMPINEYHTQFWT
ncbi:DUF4157 domain-containing protein [Microcoleus sp. Pol11C2]|uniref:DUF4157 domain-containing protein n=1 Tax=Microcoleus sp. Pol11C2 TaxID=3055389 RepID=UPI002FD1CEA7